MVPFKYLICASILLAASLSGADARRRGGASEAANEVESADGASEVADEAGSRRSGKLFNVFQVVRFPNDACNTTSGDGGVCYSESECSEAGGTSSGSCASGFGVCCSFSIGCGQSSSENNTYFESGTDDSSPCSVSICKCDDDICQLRLSFETFSIAGPDSTVASDDSDTRVAATNCVDASFVTTSDGTAAPVICGENAGYHMILEADDSCNTLNFNFLDSDDFEWKIKIIQIACDDPNKPPEGCLQYFTAITDTIESYNFDGGCHLANQNYQNCIRTAQGYCSIKWVQDDTFELSAAAEDGLTSELTGAGCNTDYVTIPGGFESGEAFNDFNVDKFCGDQLVVTDEDEFDTDIVYTVCSETLPFRLGVRTDEGEYDSTIDDDGIDDDDLKAGFQLTYTQEECT